MRGSRAARQGRLDGPRARGSVTFAETIVYAPGAAEEEDEEDAGPEEDPPSSRKQESFGRSPSPDKSRGSRAAAAARRRQEEGSALREKAPYDNPGYLPGLPGYDRSTASSTEEGSIGWWHPPAGLLESDKAAEKDGALLDLPGLTEQLEQLRIGLFRLGWVSPAQWSDGRRLGCAAVAVFAVLGLLGLTVLLVSTALAGPTGRVQQEQGSIQGNPTLARPAAPAAPEPVAHAARVSSPAEELLPWEAAQLKAAQVEVELTDEERLSLLVGTGVDPTQVPGYFVGNTQPIPRLGIPALKMQDASAGFRPTDPGEAGTTTCWPSMLALASTWDEGVVEQVARGIGREFRGKGANVVLGPGVNVHRATRGGRNFEYISGEDPYLGARLTRAYVHGVQSEGMMATVKHFAFNEQETDRKGESSVVDQKTAWELYYPPFEAAIEAGAGAVMCAYNRVNGTHACENEHLLRRDLKGAMGFPGFVMSDWGATHSTRSLANGLDMEMPGASFFRQDLIGDMSSLAMRDAALRVLTSIYHLRLDRRPGCTPPCSDERRSNQRTSAHAELSRRAATAGVVLVKNDGVLPLDTGRVRTLALLGPAADAQDDPQSWRGSPYAGGGSGHVMTPRVVSPLQGIRERAKREGMRVVSSSTATGALKVALEADVVVVVGATTAAEGIDRASLALDGGVDELVFAVARIRPTVVLVEAPGAVLTPWRHKAAAVACLFLGGEETGSAWASVLFGDASPTGRLPIELPATDADEIEPGSGKEVVYKEGLFTSYRSPRMRSAYPFGHGLSYTRFDYSKPRQWIDGCAAAACVRVVVTNVGDRAGREVAQAYVQFNAEAKEPPLVLRGFRRTRELKPREHEELLFSFTARDLSTYHAGNLWVQESDVLVHIGASSSDIRHVVPVRALQRTVGDAVPEPAGTVQTA